MDRGESKIDSIKLMPMRLRGNDFSVCRREMYDSDIVRSGAG